jgi:hypothetical protein
MEKAITVAQVGRVRASSPREGAAADSPRAVLELEARCFVDQLQRSFTQPASEVRTVKPRRAVTACSFTGRMAACSGSARLRRIAGAACAPSRSQTSMLNIDQ